MRNKVAKHVRMLVVGTAAIGLTAMATAQSEMASETTSETARDPANLLPAEKTLSPRAVPAALPQASTSKDETVQQILPDIQEWSVSGATALADYLENIGAEGLNPGDYQIAELRALIAGGNRAELADVASRNFAWVVEDLRDGRTPMDARKQWFVVDPDADRYPTTRLLQQAAASGDVAGTLAAIMPEHPDYARLRDELANTPVANAKKRRLIQANMDRWRWLARDLGLQYLMTNVPEYQLRLTVNDKIISTYKTIVGKPGRTATPQLAEMVEGVIFNPTWTVPQSIVKGEGLGAKVLNNPAWARRAGYKATKGANGWVTVVQQPGEGNSLGRMKLDMPNKHAIFLHDTPSRGLFNNASRALSHGCIRTERARELAITLAILGNNASTKEERVAAADEAVGISTSGKYTRVPIEKRLPVYITYFTMAQDIDGRLATFKDIYDRDAPVLASFDAPREANRARVTGEQIIPIEDDLRTT